jgi:hypothetical protein
VYGVDSSGSGRDPVVVCRANSADTSGSPNDKKFLAWLAASGKDSVPRS